MQGKFTYYANASGTVTVPVGATVKQIIVHSTAGGTITIFGGASIPIITGTGTIAFRFNHDNCVAGQNAGGGNTIVFTGTDSYYVETIGPAY